MSLRLEKVFYSPCQQHIAHMTYDTEERSLVSLDHSTVTWMFLSKPRHTPAVIPMEQFTSQQETFCQLEVSIASNTASKCSITTCMCLRSTSHPAAEQPCSYHQHHTELHSTVCMRHQKTRTRVEEEFGNTSSVSKHSFPKNKTKPKTTTKQFIHTLWEMLIKVYFKILADTSVGCNRNILWSDRSAIIPCFSQV